MAMDCPDRGRWVRRGPILLAGLAFLLCTACEDPGQVTVTPHPVPPPPASQPEGQTALLPTRSASAEADVEIAESKHTLTGTNLRLADLFSIAYRTPEGTSKTLPLLSTYRVISPEALPATRYDVRVYVPGGNAERLRAALRKPLADSFGLTARRELREVTAHVLTAPSGRFNSTPPSFPAPRAGANEEVLSGSDLPQLTTELEERLNQAVVDETHLPGGYLLRLPLKLSGDRREPLSVETLRTALREQLGLELTPQRRTVGFIIVEGAGRSPAAK